jgi:hypothetical protein
LLYHGTSNAFNKVGEKLGTSWLYASPNPKYSDIFIKTWDRSEYFEGSNIMPVYMSIQNPLDLRPLGLLSTPNQITEYLMSCGIDITDYYNRIFGPNREYDTPIYLFVLDLRIYKALYERIIKSGYDGIIL